MCSTALVLKLAAHGDLLSHVRNKQQVVPELVSILHQVPSGFLHLVEDSQTHVQVSSAMCHLVEHRVVHRDVAARNVLIVSMTPLTVVLSDFGSMLPTMVLFSFLF